MKRKHQEVIDTLYFSDYVLVANGMRSVEYTEFVNVISLILKAKKGESDKLKEKLNVLFLKGNTDA